MEGVLPNMGPRLGIFSFMGLHYPSDKSKMGVPSNFYPDHALLNDEQWRDILAFYSASAPYTLTRQERKEPISMNHLQFSPVMPKKNYLAPVSTYVGIDTAGRKILQADGLQKMIYVYSDKLDQLDSASTGSMVVDAITEKNKLIVCNIGIINPQDGRFGKIEEFVMGKNKSTRNLFDSLRRPVQLIEADLNGDFKKDFLVCEFGNLLGALSWLENKGDDHFERHVLRETPGAIHAIVQDYNHDGLPDIWVLFAQGDEGIMLFTNKGNGQFDQQSILRFPPVYGSSYFELADFDGDGYTDIVYASGDNGDFSQILKPYHGVYIFLNDGQQHFTQSYFYPIHGCFKVIARDFDGDGDPDIAAISYFADYAHQPEEGFVYLENKGGLQFTASTLKEAESGRWLTMDAGDLDGDGKPDIVLGNFSVGPSPIRSNYDWKKGPPFLFLKNIRHTSGAVRK